MNRTFMLIMLAGTFFSAISQVLLKQSANMEYKNPLREYLNWRVILAYGIFFGVLLLNTWCYTKVDMKFGPADPERKDFTRKDHRKSDHHPGNPCLYLMIIKMPAALCSLPAFFYFFLFAADTVVYTPSSSNV